VRDKRKADTGLVISEKLMGDQDSLPEPEATDPVVDELYEPEPDQVVIRLPEAD